MTFAAVGGGMGSGKRKIGCIVIEAVVIGLSVRMAFQASHTLVEVAPHIIMFVIHFSLVVLVAVDATEHSIVAGIGMAFVAADPFSVVASGINGKILCVMEHELRRFPARFRGMALLTYGGDVR